MGFMSFLKSSSGVIFARALYLEVLGHEPLFRWLFNRLIEFVRLSIFSWMEFSSSLCRDLFLSELPLVLGDFGGSSLRRFLPLSLLVFSEPVRLFGFLLTWPLPARWLVRCIPLTFLSLSVWDTVIVKICRIKDFPLLRFPLLKIPYFKDSPF